MSKNSSLNALRKSNKDSFFLPESDEEMDQVMDNDNDDDFDVDNMDFPLPSDGADADAIARDTPLTAEQRAQIEALMGSGAVGGKGNIGSDGVRYVSGDELEHWMQVYPCYIDGTKTAAEGRRIPKELACKKQPWAKDIVEALKELQLSQAFE
ncbi:hypothetical protein BG004_000165, partial [Podila humilis]